MHKMLLAGFAALLIFSAFNLNAGCSQHEELITLDIGGGYRQDWVKWGASRFSDNHIANENSSDSMSSNTPHFLSKLSWHDLQMYTVYGSASMTTVDRIYMRIYGEYGTIHHGWHTDKDFIVPGNPCLRDIEVVRAHAHSNEGDAFDLSAGIGYTFTFLAGRASISPISGYSHHEQHLTMRHLVIERNEIDFFTGPVPGLHSNYRPKWYGPWAGADFTLKMTSCWELFGTAEYHWPRIRGKGHWNLRTDFTRDFKQQARGYGQIYKIGLNYVLSRYWTTGLLVFYQKFQTCNGKLTEHFHDRRREISLHSIRWRSLSVMANAKYAF